MEYEVQSLIREAARATLLELGFTLAGVDDAVAIVTQAALNAQTVRDKFSYAVTEDAAVSKGKGQVTIVKSIAHSNDILPNYTSPSVVRKRCRKFKLTLDHYMSPATVELFNVHYNKIVDLEFTHVLYHDHPEAAASRKLETEVAMSMLRSKGADLLRIPTNGYDTSVIDVGGDWRYHHVREQFGVHTDAPFLDSRDASRDARKRMQLDHTQDNQLYVCRHKMQDCVITAPFMMAIHSVLYTQTILDICESMAKRGTWYFVGTMQLPEQLDKIYDTYVDPHYGYEIDYVSKDIAIAGRYLPPQMRVGVGKYLFDDNKTKLRYRYPAGESREYVHDRDVLIEKLYPGKYHVNTIDGLVQTYQYTIVKRVGSLIYVTIELQQAKQPAHKIQMLSRVAPYTDGYAVGVDGNMLSDFFITAFRSTDVIVPRQLFTAVAAHCLEKTLDPAFTIESAISYGYSAATQYEANGVILHHATLQQNRNLCVVTASIAGFFWAFDRRRLIEARVPQMTITQQQVDMVNKGANRLSDIVAWKSVFSAAKMYLAKGTADIVVDKLISLGTTYADLKRLYDKLSSLMSPGIYYIKDLATFYPSLQPLHNNTVEAGKYYSRLLVRSFPPLVPSYELEESNSLSKVRQYCDLIREDRFSDAATLFANSEVHDADIVNDISCSEYTKIAIEAINITEAGQAEKEQTALEIYRRSFDPITRDIRDMEILKGLVKGRPTLLYVLNDDITKIVTLEKVYMKGESSYEKMLLTLTNSRCIFPERVEGKIEYGTCVLKSDGNLISDKQLTTSNQRFTALIMPDLRIQNAHRLKALRMKLMSDQIVHYPVATLANECAGSGKTHDQCIRYMTAWKNGQRAAIFASTKAAAGQAISRLTEWKINIAPMSISTVDSFLMNKDAWMLYDEVYIDEALQLHAGKILCIAYLTKASVIRGYGDRKQIGFIPFTRFYHSVTESEFRWSSEQTNLTTRRIPNDVTIVNWLRSPDIYGFEFKSVSQREKAVVLMAQFTSLEEKLTLRSLYTLLSIPIKQQLMILVYLQDEALRLRSKMNLTRYMPENQDDQEDDIIMPACICTIGEAQGEDVDNVVLLRLSSKAEPLHVNVSHTTVALTRHKRRWAYLSVTSQFPSLIDDFAGKIPTYVNFESALVGKTVIKD